jgi:site-specific recombinase XerD
MDIRALETTNENRTIVENMALKIAKEAPELKDLNSEQLDQIAKIVITQRLTNELNEKANIADVDYRMEKEVFLLQAGKSGSHHTTMSYRNSLKLLERYTKRNNLNILQLTYGQADDFMYTLTGSPNSKRLIIAGVSSFYSYMERRNATIKNPIRGTKARPTAKTIKEINIPDDDEMPIILNSLPELERLAVYIMAYRGLRIGALNKLKVWGSHYQSYSKGKDINGEFPLAILTAIKQSDFDNKLPFANFTTNALKLRIYRQTQKLVKAGKINSAYSGHDFRHYYAVSEYKKDKDIYKLSKLLDHSNIAITETYLKTLKVKI